MKKYTVRPAQPDDAATYVEWLKAASDRNLVDTTVYSYPTCMTLVSEGDGKPELINSVHATLTLEALAPKPGLKPIDEARALLALFEQIRAIALATGVMEIYFTCKDESLEKFILRKGFEKVNTPTYRMKLGGATDPCNRKRPKGKLS